MAITGSGKFIDISGSYGESYGGIKFGRVVSGVNVDYLSTSMVYEEAANGTITKKALKFYGAHNNSNVFFTFSNLSAFLINGYRSFTGTIRVAVDMPILDNNQQVSQFDGNATYNTFTFKNGLWIS